MRHTAAFRYQFSSYGLRNAHRLLKSTAPADIQEKILATDGEVPTTTGSKPCFPL